MRSAGQLDDHKAQVHQELTELTGPEGSLFEAPPELFAHFDAATRIRIAHEYLALQHEVQAGGRVVVYGAGPLGAGKSSALSSLKLEGYRKIDPDVAKDLILEEQNATACCLTVMVSSSQTRNP